MHFDETALAEPLKKALADIGFSTMTPIQEKTIARLAAQPKQNIIGLAQTGTGKTAAFLLPLLNTLHTMEEKEGVKALILSPTRELCLQISDAARQFSAHLPQISTVTVYGGADIVSQMKQLRQGADLVVATPGRLIDLAERKKIDLASIETLILDEADSMLDMGFRDDLEYVLDRIRPEASVWMFSATMPQEIREISARYIKDAETVSAEGATRAASALKHHAFLVPREKRYDALKRLLDADAEMYAIIFCRTRAETAEIAEELQHDGYLVNALHGDMSQAAREQVINNFKRRRLQLITATDVASRGIDVNNLTHVIHYRLPDDHETYIHRSGRTARAGKTGQSFIIAERSERYKIQRLEQRLKIEIEKGRIPSLKDIVKERIGTAFDLLMHHQPIEHAAADKLLATTSLAHMPPDEILRRYLALHIAPMVEYYGGKDEGFLDEPDFKRDGKGPRSRERFEENGHRVPKKKGKRDRESFGPTEKIRVSIGKQNHVTAGGLIRLLCDISGISSQQIGHIKFFDKHSVVEVAPPAAKKILKHADQYRFDGKRIQVAVGK